MGGGGDGGRGGGGGGGGGGRCGGVAVVCAMGMGKVVASLFLNFCLLSTKFCVRGLLFDL